MVNVASTSGLGYGGSSSVYASTKAALILLTKEWAHALGPDVRGQRHRAERGGRIGLGVSASTPHDLARHVAKLPLRRAGKPEDYAEVIFYLLAGAGYITGPDASWWMAAGAT